MPMPIRCFACALSRCLLPLLLPLALFDADTPFIFFHAYDAMPSLPIRRVMMRRFDA